MSPIDPDEPLPTTPVAPTGAPPAAPPPAPHAAPPPPGYAATPGWAAGPPGWGGPPPGWGPAQAAVPPPSPPRRDRLAMGIVAFIFGGLFLVFFGFLLLAYTVVRGESPSLSTGPRIGVVEVKGGIGMGGGGGAESEPIMKHLRRFHDDDGIKAVVIRIDSPGGAVAPSQEIHDEVVRLAKKKVVVCSLGNLAASGGFYVAVACPKIVALPGTLTGSIGVVSQFVNVKGLAERFDVKVETIKSGKLKDLGNPFRDLSPEDRAYWERTTMGIYEQFLGAVVAGRKLDEQKVRAVADGRVITGLEARDLGLVDVLGNFYVAVDLAKAEAKLSGEPTLVYPPEDGAHLLENLLGGAAGALARGATAGVERGVAEARQPGLYLLAR
ncbi:MAG: signal peptide peptidase SppA [Anaeromyxobacter sp.]|nr:signal peptide peptidase SppA [Anaeromyxobacter sp.]